MARDVAKRDPKLPSARQLVAAVGCRFGTPPVRKLMAALGWTASLRAALASPEVAGEAKVTTGPNRRAIVVEFKTRKIALIFMGPEADNPYPPKRDFPDGRFELCEIQMSKGYTGELPEKLALTDKLAGVERKLKTKRAYRTRGCDVWGRNKYMVSIRFSRTGAMQSLSLFDN